MPFGRSSHWPRQRSLDEGKDDRKVWKEDPYEEVHGDARPSLTSDLASPTHTNHNCLAIGPACGGMRPLNCRNIGISTGPRMRRGALKFLETSRLRSLRVGLPQGGSLHYSKLLGCQPHLPLAVDWTGRTIRPKTRSSCSTPSDPGLLNSGPSRLGPRNTLYSSIGSQQGSSCRGKDS